MFVLAFVFSVTKDECIAQRQFYNPDQDECVVQCPNPYVGHLDKVCKKDKCPENQTAENQECKCDVQSKPSADKQSCLKFCTLEHQEWDGGNGCICNSAYVQLQDKSCAKSCPDNQFIEALVCVAQCSSVVAIDGKTCADSCPTGQTNVSGFCKCGKYVGEDKVSCVESCKVESVISGTFCVAECPASQFIGENRVCVATCPASLPFIDISGKFCIQRCGEGQNAVGQICTCAKFVGSGGASCVDACQANELISSSGKRCLVQCPAAELADVLGKNCVASCAYDQINASGKCTCDVAKHFLFDPLSGKCLCAQGFKPVALTCECEQAVVNGACQLCPATAIFTEGKCVCRDSQNEAYDKDSNSCILKNAGKLSSGAIIGIVIAVAAVLVLVGITVYLWYSRKLHIQELKIAEKQTVMDTPHTYL